MYESYFNSLGYKVANPKHQEYIVKGFQSHAGLTADGVIGTKTRAKIKYYNQNNYCPEVFEPIKPYVPYTDEQIESLMIKNFVGLGAAFNEQSRINNIDVLHNIGHGGLESGWGTSKIARDKNNLYGWNAVDNSSYNSAYGFVDFETCIKEWTVWWDKTYLTPGGSQYRGNNEYSVNVVYASSPVAGINKSFIVQRLRKQLTGEESQVWLPNDKVPGAKDFRFKEGFSNTQINGVRKIKVDPIPQIYMNNAIKVFQNLQLIRNHFNTPVIISYSGNLYRNPHYNNISGGSSTSQHLIANGSDTRIVGVPSMEVFRWAKDNTEFNGFGIINATWIHLDLRKDFWFKEY